MKPRAGWIILAALLLGACAGESCRAPAGNASLTPDAVSAAGGPLGVVVQWGGVLVGVSHLRDSTELEVVGYPLDGCGRPRTGSAQTGRFIIVRPGFLETADYRAGQRVSATGRVNEVRPGRIGDARYDFPVLETHKVRLLPEETAARGYRRPWVSIGIGGGSGGVGGGVGVVF